MPKSAQMRQNGFACKGQDPGTARHFIHEGEKTALIVLIVQGKKTHLILKMARGRAITHTLAITPAHPAVCVKVLPVPSN